MRDLMSKTKVPPNVGGETPATGSLGSSSGQVDKEKKRLLDYLHNDTCSAILETSFLRLLKKEKALPETVLSLGTLELWSDDFEGKGEFSQYRSRLVC